jgi:hypothetical protein
MNRMRLLKDVLPTLRQIDPYIPLTTNAIRKLALCGTVKTVMIGRKRLINVDDLINFLNIEE